MPVINATSIQQSDTYSLQSANVFLHCMRRKKYLKSILLNHAFIPRYNIEDISYLHLKQYNKIGIPMVCFCDIFLNRLRPHMKNYGRYGIGLKKDHLINSGLNPVFYINPNSFFYNDLSHIEQTTLNQLEDENSVSNNEDMLDYQIFQLMYIKPLSGIMRLHGKNKRMNFHDECEWRYIPDMRYTELPSFIFDKEILFKETQLNFYNDALAKYKVGWLSFSYDAIKYIIIDKEEDRGEFIDFILHEIDTNQDEKYRMISKIIAYRELEGDF